MAAPRNPAIVTEVCFAMFVLLVLRRVSRGSRSLIDECAPNMRRHVAGTIDLAARLLFFELKSRQKLRSSTTRG
jgi:hypothetical protein